MQGAAMMEVAFGWASKERGRGEMYAAGYQ